MNKYLNTLAVLATSLATVGCAQLEQVGKAIEDNHRRLVAREFSEQADKQLATAFYGLNDKGERQLVGSLATQYDLRTSTWAVNVLRKIVDRSPNTTLATDDAQRANVDIMDEPAAKVYIAAVHARGNKVKLFKPRMAQAINGMFHANHFLNPDKNTTEYYGIAGALIEYTQDDQVVSALTKSRQMIVTFGASVFDYTHVRYGRAVAQRIENEVPNSVFAENFIREVRRPNKS